MPNFGVALINLCGLMPKFGVNYSKMSFIILVPGPNITEHLHKKA